MGAPVSKLVGGRISEDLSVIKCISAFKKGIDISWLELQDIRYMGPGMPCSDFDLKVQIKHLTCLLANRLFIKQSENHQSNLPNCLRKLHTQHMQEWYLILCGY